MGFFSTKKKVVVSSTLYNLSGDEDTRDNFHKSNMFSAILSPQNLYLGETIINNLFSGPEIKQRRFFNWAVSNGFSGVPNSTIKNMSTVDFALVEPHISRPVGNQVDIYSAFISNGDFYYFAEKYILENNPAIIDTEWVCEYNLNSNTIIIKYENGSTQTISAGTYSSSKQYIVAYYITYTIPPYEATSGTKMYIYELGTGISSLDALETDINISPEFYPIIPIRINNVSITDPVYDSNGFYADCERAYKRAFNEASFQKIIETVEDSEDIGQIDYAYVAFGVPLNTKSMSGKRYIYEFLRGLIPYQETTPAYMSQLISDINSYDPTDYPQQKVPQPKVSTIVLKTNDPRTQSYDVRVSWVNVRETSHLGLGKPDAKSGDVWLEKGTSLTWGNNTLEVIKLYKQNTGNYTLLTVYGLIHNNYIYGGKSVLTKSNEALDTTDEESPFLIPIHKPSMRRISLIDSTQIATESGFIIFNCYKIFKKKWYQSGLFKIVIFIVIIVASVVFNPGTAATATGILGTNAAVGTYLGFIGVTAIIAGAIANALAAMVLSMLIMEASTTLLGDKLGSIIGAILSFVTTLGLSGGFDNFTLLSADGLLSVTNVLANGYSGLSQANIEEIQGKMLANNISYEKTMKDIDKLLKELTGTNNLYFDPLQFTDISDVGNEQGNYSPETLDGFIQRTLLVGGDIAELSIAMITKYPEIKLQLPKF